MRDSLGRDRRDIFVDTLRVGAVLVVVVGHWMTTTVIWDEGRIASENALSVIPEAHLATWVLQVMPLLFFVGGFSNARSLAHHGGEYLAYLRGRLVRLLTPTIVFISAWLAVGVAAEALPLPQPNIAETAADVAALPMWFLGLYVMVVALAPLLWWVHRRLNWWAPVVLIVGAAIVDVLVYGFEQDGFGVVNYAFVWLFPHQLGFFYADGRLERATGRAAGGAAVVGLLGLAVAVTAGGYPVSLIGVPGESRWNTDPPSLALIAVALWLIGLALLVRPRLLAWAEHRPRLVERLNGVVLTMYLWHVSAIAIAAAVVYPLGFPRPAIGSTLWWAARTLWVLVLIPVLLLLVGAFRRFEVHRPPWWPAGTASQLTRHAAAAIGVVSMAMGILGFSVTGFDRVATEAGGTLLAFSMNPLQSVMHVGVGVVLLWVVYRPASAAAVATVASLFYALLGVSGWSSGVAPFAMNPATARLHTVVGMIGLALLAATVAADRARSLPTRRPGDQHR